MGRFAYALLGAAGALVVVAALAAGAALSGIYEIGADKPHSKLVERAIDTVRERSIERRAADVAVPDLAGREMIAEGAEHYAAMCAGCHLAPGRVDSELREGLYPRPPDLARNPVEDPRRAFWIIKHGVKMTAMPAWGASHSDGDIWNIVAFLQQMPKLRPEEYRGLLPAPSRDAGETQPVKSPDSHGDGHPHRHEDDHHRHHAE